MAHQAKACQTILSDPALLVQRMTPQTSGTKRKTTAIQHKVPPRAQTQEVQAHSATLKRSMFKDLDPKHGFVRYTSVFRTLSRFHVSCSMSRRNACHIKIQVHTPFVVQNIQRAWPCVVQQRAKHPHAHKIWLQVMGDWHQTFRNVICRNRRAPPAPMSFPTLSAEGTSSISPLLDATGTPSVTWILSSDETPSFAPSPRTAGTPSITSLPSTTFVPSTTLIPNIEVLTTPLRALPLFTAGDEEGIFCGFCYRNTVPHTWCCRRRQEFETLVDTVDNVEEERATHAAYERRCVEDIICGFCNRRIEGNEWCCPQRRELETIENAVDSREGETQAARIPYEHCREAREPSSQHSESDVPEDGWLSSENDVARSSRT